MSLIPLNILPGVCKVDSEYASQNRYSDMDKVRFIAGKAEKIGGNVQTGDTFPDNQSGVALQDFRDNAGIDYLAVGTSAQLWAGTIGLLADISPFRSQTSSTLTNPLDTTISSTTVTVNHTAHGQLAGDYVILSTGTAVGGIQPVGVFIIQSAAANSYTIANTSAATSSVSAGGGTVSYTYYRVKLTTPFATTSGSPTVVVTHNAYGSATFDYVIIAGATAVAGLTLNGTYKITNINANSYSITASSNANATTTGGGTPTVRYEISSESLTSGWALAKYGQQLLAAPIAIQGTTGPATIYVYDPTIAGHAQPLYNAPSSMFYMFVTPERYIFALGTTIPMRLQWPDQTDNTQWTPTATNTANSRTLQEGAYLISGIAVRDGISMVFSDTAAYVFTYTGDSFVYKDTLAGNNCGIAGPHAVATVNGVVYWMGKSEFWTWNGSVQPLPSDDIRDHVFKNIDTTDFANCVCGINVAKKEVWFFYPTGINGFCNAYVIYHIDQNCWSSGTLSVANILAWLDKGLFMNPIATFRDSKVWYMEDGTTWSADSDNAYVTFGPFDISSGDKNMDVFSYIPDFQRQTGNCTLEVSTQTYPNDTPVSVGTYTLSTNTGRIDLRVGAKLISGTLRNNTAGGDFRIGLPRVEAQPSGARR